MKFSSVALAAGLLAVASAQPVHHHNLHKREADPGVEFVTVQQTYYVTAGNTAPAGVASAAATLATQSVASAVAAAANSDYSAANAQVVPSSTLTTVVAVAESSSASSSAAESSASASSGSSSPSTGAGDAGALGITYSPYTSSGGCKSASEVASDLSALTGYSVIRLYGVDCDQVANVYAAKASSQKLFLGVYYTDALQEGLEAIKSGINSDWDCVHTISIGNELVNAGSASVSEVVSLTSSARSTLRGWGYTGPVVSVDTFIAVINNPGLCEASDYMAVNAHAFFDGYVTAADAGSWALLQIQRVWSACNGEKTVLISESGWPSQGESNNVAVPSTDNLKSAISSLKSTVGADVILFNAYNDLWKSPGSYNCEQYWGILDA